MQRGSFPDPRTYVFPEWVRIGDYYYNACDIVAFGTPLTVENLISAYRLGIFPWFIEDMPLPWYCPQQRAIIDFSELKVPRSLAKVRRNSRLRFTIDADFRGVMEACSLARRSRESGKTWITSDFLRVYGELHDAGQAHSVEVWNEADELVGGLYGVDAGGVFCGESMFHTTPNASKLALLFLIDHLRGRGAEWIDIQVMTPHLEAMGAAEIDRREFLDKLKATQEQDLVLFNDA